MGVAPGSLLTTRSHMAAITGSPLGDIGIAPDASHLDSGGYHCGAGDLFSINAVANDDYSIRQTRDRNQYNYDRAHGLNLSSAMDYPDDWPNGGRAAWIRFNNILRAQLGAQDPMLRAIRGINYTPNGTTKRRFDCRTLTESSTTDTVTWHTHIEWWRDTINDTDARDDATTRLCQIARAAIANVSLATIVAQDTAAPVSHLTEEVMQIVTVLDPPAGALSINGKPLVSHSRGYITPAGWWGLDDSNYGKFHSDTDYWNHSPEFTWAEIQQLSATMRQDPAAIVAGVLQGLANDPSSDVTQADIDGILTALAATPDAVRQEFRDHPIS